MLPQKFELISDVEREDNAAYIAIRKGRMRVRNNKAPNGNGVKLPTAKLTEILRNRARNCIYRKRGSVSRVALDEYKSRTLNKLSRRGRL